MVGAFGEVQVMDWGLAKVLGDGRAPSPDGDPDATAGRHGGRVGRGTARTRSRRPGACSARRRTCRRSRRSGRSTRSTRRSDVFGLGGDPGGDPDRPAAVRRGYGRDDSGAGRRGQGGGLLRPAGRLRGGAGAGGAVQAVPGARGGGPAGRRGGGGRGGGRAAGGGRRAGPAGGGEAWRRRPRPRRRRAAEAAAGVAGGGAALAVAVVGGLGAVLAVQRRANADLAAANGKLAAKNNALEAERVKVEQRFEMARKAIAAFHTTVDEQPELGNEAFRPLREKLLTAAAGFYRELEGLLANEPDPKSRAALADGYFQLAELTSKVGDQTQAVDVFRKALALRQELGAGPGADGEARLAVSVTVRRLGGALLATGDTAGALRAYENARDVAAALVADAPTDDNLQALAGSHHSIGAVLSRTGQPVEAMAAYQRARDLRQKVGRCPPCRHRLPERPGPKPYQHRYRAAGPDGQAGRGVSGVPRGAGDPAEAGRGQPHRHRLQERPCQKLLQHRRYAALCGPARKRRWRRPRRPETSIRRWPSLTPP